MAIQRYYARRVLLVPLVLVLLSTLGCAWGFQSISRATTTTRMTTTTTTTKTNRPVWTAHADIRSSSSSRSALRLTKRTRTQSRPEESTAIMDLDGERRDCDHDVVGLVDSDLSLFALATTTTAVGLAVLSEAANVAAIEMPKQLQQSFDPSSFVPVCGASDGFYRFLQSTAQTVVGKENFIEYGPLIASGLLRVRLELCVVESFFNEAVGPFIQQNGLSWVLPLHETVETFLAGTVFALATTFILVGSTKLLTVIFTYADFLVGGPLRFVGGYIFDRARGKPVTLDVGLGPFKTRVIGPKDVQAETNDYDYVVDFDKVSAGEIPVVVVSGGVKAFGQTIGLLREVLDSVDLFVGKSLILWVTAYVGIKFIHFKVFPDFP